MRPALTAGHAPTAPEAPASPPVATSAELLRGGRRLLILHAGEVYTLQVTRQNRLLLTK